jgi:flagellar FliL protein
MVIEEVTAENGHGDKAEGDGHGSKTTEKATESEHVEAAGAEGPVLPAEQSVTVNLQDGNFLKIGIAIQLPAGADVKLAKEEGLLAKATDLTLKEVAAHDLKDLVPPTARVKIQQNLSMKTCKETKATILGVLFTEFVFQEK